MRRALLLALALFTASAATAKTVVVGADHMIDVLAGARVDNVQVTIVDGRITNVGHRGDAVPTDADKIDLGPRAMNCDIRSSPRRAAVADLGPGLWARRPAPATGRHATGDTLEMPSRLRHWAVS